VQDKSKQAPVAQPEPALYGEKAVFERDIARRENRIWAPEFLLRSVGSSALNAILSGSGALFTFILTK
jgi:hypothetical protein